MIAARKEKSLTWRRGLRKLGYNALMFLQGLLGEAFWSVRERTARLQDQRDNGEW
jgi:hypothetical protein